MHFFHNIFCFMQLNRHMKTNRLFNYVYHAYIWIPRNHNLFIVFEKQKRFSLQLGLWDNWLVIWFYLWVFCVQVYMFSSCKYPCLDMTLFHFFHLFDLHWIKLVCGCCTSCIWKLSFECGIHVTYVGFLHDILNKDLDLIIENKYQG